jgi:hypothetical protein
MKQSNRYQKAGKLNKIIFLSAPELSHSSMDPKNLVSFFLILVLLVAYNFSVLTCGLPTQGCESGVVFISDSRGGRNYQKQFRR